MSERSSNNTAPSVNRPVEDTQSDAGTGAPESLNIWPWSDDPSQEQIDFVKSRFTTTARTSLSVLARRILTARSLREVNTFSAQVNSLYRSRAARISRPARRAAEAASTAASQSQQEIAMTAGADSATRSASNNTTQDGTIRPDDAPLSDHE